MSSGTLSLLQVALRPPQVVLLHFQLGDDHLHTIQLDALEGFRPLLQALEKTLYDLWGCQIPTERLK
jgi:hypothetical protein